MTIDPLHRALDQWDPAAFAGKHGAAKESRSHRSHEWLYPCPMCGSSRLRYNDQKHTWICWGCNTTGDTLKLIQIFERVSLEGAIEYVYSGYVGGDARIDKLEEIISFEPIASLRQGPAWNALRTLPAIPWPRGVDLLTTPNQVHWRAWDYLVRHRGVNAELIRQYGLGFGRSGRLKDYILFPVYMDHALVYWQGRATWDPPPGTKEERKAWEKETKYRKTLNPWIKDEDSDQATASDVIFNWDRARAHEHIVVCEGPIDAMKVGIHAVALLGKAPSPAKIDRLTRIPAQRFTIYLDRGEEEQAYAKSIGSELEPFGEVRICIPPEGHDPGSLTAEQNAAIVANASRFRSDLLTSELK